VSAAGGGVSVGVLHERLVYQRRLRALRDAISPLLPRNARILDVGCGDGLLDAMLMEVRPDVRISGIDVLARPRSYIPVEHYDGRTIPHDEGAFDAVLIVDVLHHTEDPSVLIREAARISPSCVIIKDHTRNGFLAGPTLRLMDWAGNARHGVALPYNYWTRRQWDTAFATAGLAPTVWLPRPRLYPWWTNWAFGRSLHFITQLVRVHA
jgi:SAM-dependent methyltransferase